MSEKFIKDEELDELDALYAMKQSENSGKKKSSSEKTAKAAKPEKSAKTEKTNKSNKTESAVKTEKEEKSEKPVKVIKNEDDKPEKKTAKKEKKPKKKAIPEQDKATSLTNIIICGAVFVTSIVLLFVLERPTISMTEKRELAKFPEFSWEAYWSGKYTSEISNWFNDTVPFRDELKSMGAVFRSFFGFSDGQIVGPSQKVESNESEVTTATTKPIQIVTPPPKTKTESEGTTATPKPVNPETTIGGNESDITPSDITVNIIKQSGDDVIYTTDNADGYQLYASLYSGDRKNVKRYSEALKVLKEKTGADVYSLICPTQNTFLTPKELNKGHYTEQSDTAFMNNNMDNSIKVVDAFAALSSHSGEDLFFARDKHWKQLAAYYAAESFAKQAGIKLLPLDSFEKDEKQCYGSMYQIFRDYDYLLYSYETFTYYMPKNEYLTNYYDERGEFQFEYPYMPVADYHEDNFYGLFGVADNYIQHITTDSDNNKKLVILKDDYMNSMVPFLIPSYSEIYVVDVRYAEIDLAQFITEKGADDVLVGMTASDALGIAGDIFATNLGVPVEVQDENSSEDESSTEE